ncbi:glycosyltransferase [Anaerovorax odorimutans]|uniref:glycosyltransferase n=1 Tax=Anaerovorax odorimutans TaxID=109327 RepID=UPI00041B8D48|nr:glycosyltransferase [Anaerovorax odorimutans]
MNKNKSAENKSVRLVIFVKEGMDSFIKEIAADLAGFYDTKIVRISNAVDCNNGKVCNDIDKEMEWGEICWFEWCDELIVYGSRHPMALKKKIICRIHSYEVFTDYPSQVNWDTVDKVIFVASHIREQGIEKFGIAREKTVIIPNGIDMKRFKFNERKPGFHIAYVGYINYKKGPMLLLQTFKAIHDEDPRYKLHIAGCFQDDRDILYFRQMIREWGFEKDIIYEGWQDDLDQWLEDKNYILCTSILESQNMSVMQAMAKGIKPIIHNFVGARKIYLEHLIFNTISEAVAMLSQDYDSMTYREFVNEKYNMDSINKILIEELHQLCETNPKEPMVSIVMTVYNREKYLKEAIESVLNQSYRHIELIIVNDGSTDSSEEIVKGFSDERIRYFHRENTGQLNALKYGLEKAEGNFLTRVDSDDLIHREYIMDCTEAMLKKSKLKFVYMDFTLIDSNGNVIGETRFKDYEHPIMLLMDTFSGFSSVIPDVSFFRRDYISNVILNYTEQNVPFYIDNILTCEFLHIKEPMYFYRQHEANFASDNDNFKQVVEGKIKFEDLLFRRYFIQMDLNRDFLTNQGTYYKLISEYFTNISQYYEQMETGDEKKQVIPQLFEEETIYWENQRNQLDEINPLDKDRTGKNLLIDNRNQRVLVVSTDDPAEGRAVGGKHTHIHLLMKGIQEQNIPCSLVTYQYDSKATIDSKKAMNYLQGQVEDDLLKNLSVEELSDSSDVSFAYLIYAIQKQLEEKIEKALMANYYSFISCQDVVAAMAAYNVIKRLKFIMPIMTTLHGYFTDENVDYGLLLKGTPVYKYFIHYEKRAYEISDKIITVDTRIKEYVTNIQLENPTPITVLKNAADDISFCPEMYQSDKNCANNILNKIINAHEISHNNIILVPRRLVPKNGVMIAVRAASELIRRGIKDFRLIIAGDGIERQAIQEYIDKNGESSHNPSHIVDDGKYDEDSLGQVVHLLGNISHDEIQMFYKIARFILIPSIKSNNVEEATSISLLEGMSCGKVVIASSLGGMKEIIEDGKNGFLVQPENVELLADRLAEVFRMEDERYNKIGAQARLDIENQYSYKAHAKKYIHLVEGKTT